jgi:DNA-binding PadR family transcriptional regulator
MQIKESEIAVLNAIHESNNATAPDLVEKLKPHFSKAHVYLLITGLEKHSLIDSKTEATGRRGPPQSRYTLTSRGVRVRSTAMQLIQELDMAGRAPSLQFLQ